MLVLSRKLGEGIVIGEGKNRVRIVVVDMDRGKVKIGVEADRSTIITREELLARPLPPKPEEK